MYTVGITRTAQKAIDKIHATDRSRILIAIYGLANDPRPVGCIKLSGRDGWRIRVGDYRIIYDVSDDALVVTVVDVGHRSSVYR